jgi:protein-tyrosine-phosphatase/DNA-binding transcriptional ArsR family regulator
MSSGQLASPPEFVQLAAHPLRWRLLTELANSDYRVRELVALVDEPQNLVSYHLRLLRDGGLVTSSRSSYDGRDTYYHLDLDRCAAGLSATAAALHPALRRAPESPSPTVDRTPRPVSVLFVCTGNSARSPIAEALLARHTDGQATAMSAGTQPKPSLHPNAVRVMREEFDIDLSDQRPRPVDPLAKRRFDRVITLCDKAREACPEFSHHPKRAHWSIADPALAGSTDRASYAAFRRMAADVDTRVGHLLPALTTTQH